MGANFLILVIAAIFVFVFFGRPVMHRRKAIEPPKLLRIVPFTLKQAINNREKIDNYYLRIKEEQRALKQRLNSLEVASTEDSSQAVRVAKGA